MSEMTDERDARIQRGITFLEERVGSVWKSLVNVEKLDLGNPSTCILGQVFADRGVELGFCSGFDYARHHLLTEYDGVVDHGFDRADSATESYDDLQAAWERVLTEHAEGGGQ